MEGEGGAQCSCGVRCARGLRLTRSPQPRDRLATAKSAGERASYQAASTASPTGGGGGGAFMGRVQRDGRPGVGTSPGPTVLGSARASAGEGRVAGEAGASSVRSRRRRRSYVQSCWAHRMPAYAQHPNRGMRGIPLTPGGRAQPGMVSSPRPAPQRPSPPSRGCWARREQASRPPAAQTANAPPSRSWERSPARAGAAPHKTSARRASTTAGAAAAAPPARHRKRCGAPESIRRLTRRRPAGLTTSCKPAAALRGRVRQCRMGQPIVRRVRWTAAPAAAARPGRRRTGAAKAARRMGRQRCAAAAERRRRRTTAGRGPGGNADGAEVRGGWGRGRGGGRGGRAGLLAGRRR